MVRRLAQIERAAAEKKDRERQTLAAEKAMVRRQLARMEAVENA